MITIDNSRPSESVYRIDNFFVPPEAREEFEQAMYRNLAFLQTLPGFQGHAVFEKTGGPTSFNVATMAIWESQTAIDAAGERVREYYQRIGFDMPSMVARLGIRAELGYFTAAKDRVAAAH